MFPLMTTRSLYAFGYLANMDYLEQLEVKKLSVLDQGYVELVDLMPRVGPRDRTPEYRIVEAARTSMGGGLKSQDLDRRLLTYLYDNYHTSPFEMCKISFILQIPEVFATHLLRHRTLKYSNVNAFSHRYSESLGLFYDPTDKLDEILEFYDPCSVDGGLRIQDKNNKQQSIKGEIGSEAKSLIEEAQKEVDKQLQRYQRMLELGVPRETARLYLPNSQYTRLFITVDLHNFLGLCFLRADFEHAQWETAMYTQAMIDLVRPLFPTTIECFENRIHGLSLSMKELHLLQNRDEIEKLPTRERIAIQKKIARL